MGRRFSPTLLLLASAGTITLAAQSPAPRFYPDDPLWREPLSQDVATEGTYEPDLVFQTLENLFGRPGDPVTGQRAKNVNTVDEVPDGAFFENRAGRVPLTPAIVARASNSDDGPPAPPWRIVAAKSDGITPGFTIRDTGDRLWFVKFDPPGWRAMATGTEVTAAKLFWALGYYTAEYHIAQLRPEHLTIQPGTEFTPLNGQPRTLYRDDIDALLARADRDADGTYRVIFSKAVPGRPVGRIAFHGTRSDDPNDIVPHEHRRELRGYRVFAAWLNHVDAKGINSLSALVTDNGRRFIRHYLLDFGSALGSAAIGPREGWEGFEPLVEKPGEIGRRAASVGVRIPEWRRLELFESRSIGRLPRDHTTWQPDKWEAHITNAAFRHMRPDDAFWAAVKLTSIDESMVRAAVEAGQFGDPESEAFLVKAIMQRRQRILETWLPAVNPVVAPGLDDTGMLTFQNAAVDAGVSQPPSRYVAAWAAFDNGTGQSRPIATTESVSPRIKAPILPAAGYVEVKLHATGGPAAWETPVTIHFRRRTTGWDWIGLERLP
jgi:hypothetical protein